MRESEFACCRRKLFQEHASSRSEFPHSNTEAIQMRLNARKLLMGGLLIVVTSMECSAQLVSSFEQLQLLVKPGDNIYVTDSLGKTTKGRIAELSPSSLGLVVKGMR